MKHRLIAIIIAIVLVIAIIPPISHADNCSYRVAPMSDITRYENYCIRGIEDEDVRFNILIDSESKTGQFAIVYFNDLDFVYEFVFNLADIPINGIEISDESWEKIRDYCFCNENNWHEIYIPSAVTITHAEKQDGYKNIDSQSRSAETAYFENWLRNKYGNEYTGNLLGTKTQGGVTMYLKAAFIVRASLDISYYLSQAMTVIGFVTAILGFSPTHPIVSVLSVIAGTGGMFEMYNSVNQYVASAIWYRYATCVSGSGYPYGMANKVTNYDGYCYSGTGTCNVDEASQYTYYVPSSSVYNSYNAIYNAAFAEYYNIGYQPGNF